MQPFRVVDIPDEPVQVLFGISERLVSVQVDLLSFQRLEETLRFGIVVRVADGRHADLDPSIVQPGDVRRARILHSTIGMVDQLRRRVPGCQCPLQRGERQRRINRS